MLVLFVNEIKVRLVVSCEEGQSVLRCSLDKAKHFYIPIQKFLVQKCLDMTKLRYNELFYRPMRFVISRFCCNFRVPKRKQRVQVCTHQVETKLYITDLFSG